MNGTRPELVKQSYSAYYNRDIPSEDAVLTHVGPGKPAGELLRRYWQPIAYSRELKGLPIRRRIMGEDLVVFRDGRGKVGLLELHCSHRGTSLEYGRIEERGIRCCYHGWQFDVDGRILDTPLEPADSTLKDRFFHGAYLVKEHRGIVWGYMGPPDKVPDLPALDLLAFPGYTLEPGELTGAPNFRPCNWLQVVDNYVDPQHEEYLHALHSGVQFVARNGKFVEELKIIGEAEYVETPTGILTLEMRRLDDETVWVRNIEYIWPNIATLGLLPQWPPCFGPRDTELHDFPITMVWAVPTDDTNTMEMSFVLTPFGQENPRTKHKMPALVANGPGRPYEDMQRMPGDFEAQVGQRPIAIHAREHLGAVDRGVAMMRKGIREAIEEVQEGRDPVNVFRDGKTVATYGGDTALRLEAAAKAEDDKRLMRRAGREMAQRYIKTPPHLHRLKSGPTMAATAD